MPVLWGQSLAIIRAVPAAAFVLLSGVLAYGAQPPNGFDAAAQGEITVTDSCLFTLSGQVRPRSCAARTAAAWMKGAETPPDCKEEQSTLRVAARLPENTAECREFLTKYFRREPVPGPTQIVVNPTPVTVRPSITVVAPDGFSPTNVASLLAIESRQLLTSVICARLSPAGAPTGPTVQCEGKTGVAVVWLRDAPFKAGEWRLAPEFDHLRPAFVKAYTMARNIVGELKQWSNVFGRGGLVVEVQGNASGESLNCDGLIRGGNDAAKPAPGCVEHGVRPCLRGDGLFEYGERDAYSCVDDPKEERDWSVLPIGRRYASEILADLRAADVIRMFRSVCGPSACQFRLKLMLATPVLPGTRVGDAAAAERWIMVLVAPHLGSDSEK